MALYRIKEYRELFQLVGFISLILGAIIFTSALLIGQGFNGGFLAILGETLIIIASLNLIFSYSLKYSN